MLFVFSLAYLVFCGSYFGLMHLGSFVHHILWYWSCWASCADKSYLGGISFQVISWNSWIHFDRLTLLYCTSILFQFFIISLIMESLTRFIMSSWNSIGDLHGCLIILWYPQLWYIIWYMDFWVGILLMLFLTLECDISFGIIGIYIHSSVGFCHFLSSWLD